VQPFREVADRVWVARYEAYDVNVTVVEGEAGLVVVDTHGSVEEGRSVLADLRRLSERPLVTIVNTHAHFDHTFGNPAFLEEGPVPVLAHESAAADSPEDVRADTTFSSVTSIDLGDRAVELVHPGRGHTGGDLVVRVGDADVLLAGDLVEESGHPAYGEDSFPLEWPWSLDLVLELVGPDTVVVPGHGRPVGGDFVQDQRSAIGVVAQTIRDLAARGVPAEQALDATEWPYPREHLAHAVRRGYAQLPRSEKRLPLA
jgi:glyoxylase-like metal-dependent hydrolase (beta-lactamase superfamily II)